VSPVALRSQKIYARSNRLGTGQQRSRGNVATLGGKISTEPRINDGIRAPEVRLVGPDGEQVGIVKIEIALQRAREAGMDLVEVAPMASPPVAKLMHYETFKIAAADAAQESRRSQIDALIKDMKERGGP
jgi:translation initiation factor IF-3